MSKPKKHPLRSLIINSLLVAVAFGLFGLVIWQNRAQIDEVRSRPLDYRLFLAAFAVYLVGMTITFLRWFLLVRVVEPRFTPGAAFRLGFIGNVFNLVIPGAVGGDFIKAAYLVQMDIKRTQAIASMVIDRILGLLGLFLLAGIAGAAAWPMAGPQVRLLIGIVWAAVACGLLVLAVIFNQSLTRAFPSLLEGHGRIAGVLRELRVLSITYRGRLDLVAGCLLGSSFIHALFVIAFYVVSRALFPSLVPGFAQHLLIVPLTLFTTAVPLPFGALGLSEQVSAQLFELVRHPGGALAMIGFRMLMYEGGLVSLGVYLANVRQVRALTDTAVELEEELVEGDLDNVLQDAEAQDGAGGETAVTKPRRAPTLE
jgi:uncharacterized membrane protein YbhN (UPF0104 family)